MFNDVGVRCCAGFLRFVASLWWVLVIDRFDDMPGVEDRGALEGVVVDWGVARGLFGTV